MMREATMVNRYSISIWYCCCKCLPLMLTICVLFVIENFLSFVYFLFALVFVRYFHFYGISFGIFRDWVVWDCVYANTFWQSIISDPFFLFSDHFCNFIKRTAHKRHTAHKPFLPMNIHFTLFSSSSFIICFRHFPLLDSCYWW